METEVLHRSGLGSSLPVENVQALASRGLEEVPPRYLRPASELGNICETESLAIPVIDMIKLGEDHPDHNDEIAKFHSACKEWGFLQLINHGISEEFMHQVKIDTEEFFKLPLEEKKKYGQLPNTIEGYGQAFVMSEDQKLDWGDMLFLFGQPIKPVPGAFIVNVGDVIEIMSNGEYKSIEHRAMVNPEKERLSIAAFHGPHMQAAIGPLPDLAGKSGAHPKTLKQRE